MYALCCFPLKILDIYPNPSTRKHKSFGSCEDFPLSDPVPWKPWRQSSVLGRFTGTVGPARRLLEERQGYPNTKPGNFCGSLCSKERGGFGWGSGQGGSLKRSAGDSPVYRGGLTTLISTLSPPRRKDPQLKILSEHSQRKNSSHLILITRDLAGREGGTVIMGFCIERTGQASMGAIPRPATRGRVEGSGLKSR